MAEHRIFATKFAKVYPLYVQKAERKNRTKEEVDQVICWLTGYSRAQLQKQIEQEAISQPFSRKLQASILTVRFSRARCAACASRK